MTMLMQVDRVYDFPTWLYGLAIVLSTIAGGVALQVAVHRVLPVRFRDEHSTAVTAIFSIIGVTYAVLLAFVAMLTWEGFNRAREATFAEAGAVAELRRLSLGLPAPLGFTLRGELDSYVRAVVLVEWPAQTRGHVDSSGEPMLDALHVAIGTAPLGGTVGAPVQAQFLTELGVLSAARQGRKLAVQPTVPPVVWAVMLVGGGLLIGFSALLGARSYALHLAMTAALCASGALVIVLIVSLDSPFRSDFRISPAAFSMQSTGPPTP